MLKTEKSIFYSKNLIKIQTVYIDGPDTFVLQKDTIL